MRCIRRRDPRDDKPERDEQRHRRSHDWPRQSFGKHRRQARDVDQEDRNRREEETWTEEIAFRPVGRISGEQRREQGDQQVIPLRRRALHRHDQHHEQHRRHGPREQRDIQPHQIRRDDHHPATRRMLEAEGAEMKSRPMLRAVQDVVRERERVARRHLIDGEQHEQRKRAYRGLHEQRGQQRATGEGGAQLKESDDERGKCRIVGANGGEDTEARADDGGVSIGVPSRLGFVPGRERGERDPETGQRTGMVHRAARHEQRERTEREEQRRAACCRLVRRSRREAIDGDSGDAGEQRIQQPAYTSEPRDRQHGRETDGELREPLAV